MREELSPGCGRLPVTKHALVTTNDSAGFPLVTGTARASQHCMHNRYRKQFVTDSDSRSLLLQPLVLPLYVSHTRNQSWSNMYTVISCTQRWSSHTIPARTSPFNFSASRNLRRLFNFSTDYFFELSQTKSQHIDCIRISPPTNDS